MRSAWRSSMPMPLSETSMVQREPRMTIGVLARCRAGADRDDRRPAGHAELERVADQVLQQLAHLDGSASMRRQRPDVDTAARLGDACSRSSWTASRTAGTSRPARTLGAAGDPRVRQQVLDQLLHPRRPRPGHARCRRAVCVERLAEAVFEPVGEGPDLAQRLLEVVGRDRREILEVAVAPLELAPRASSSAWTRFCSVMSRTISE